MAAHLRAVAPRWCRGLSGGAPTTRRQPGARGPPPRPEPGASARSRARQGGAHRRRHPSNKPWSDEVFDENSSEHHAYGVGPRHGRLEIQAVQLSQHSDAARQTLQWHRTGVQHDHVAEDALLQEPVEAIVADNKVSWWKNWEAEWDEGWDWEEKWWPAPGEALLPRDDPRRPRGPLLAVPRGGYRQVAALNHTEVANALVASRHDSLDEITWQALCRRAELVAVSFTPAEVLAVVRCVAERQAGQLKLLWKLAEMVVEKLPAFTAEDLVQLAKAYAGLDAVHHGLLNVVALVLADPEDDRRLSPTFTAELLKVYATAKYPLPLVINEAKRLLLELGPTQTAGNASEGLPGALELEPHMALLALEGLTELGALDATSLEVLLPVSFGGTGLDHEDSAMLDLSTLCAVCAWATGARKKLHALEGGQVALATMRTALCGSLARHDARHLRIIARGQAEEGPSAPTCALPRREGHGKDAAATVVSGEQLLGAAELLSTSEDAGHQSLAADLLDGATRGPSAAAWPLELQVRWVSVLLMSSCHTEGEQVDARQEKSLPLLSALGAQAAHRLVPHAPVLFQALPTIAGRGGAAPVVELALAMAPEVGRNLFRLSLTEAHLTVEGLLKLAACVADGEAALTAESATLASRLHPEARKLLTTAVESLPAKFRSESIFHKKQDGGVSPTDVLAWCQLLADRDLLELVACQGQELPEEAWRHLADEAVQVIVACGEPDETVANLLGAFAAEGHRRSWSATGSASPLAAVASAVSTEWRRATKRDGELEDPMHEPLPIAEAVQTKLRELFADLGVPELTPAAAGAAPPLELLPSKDWPARLS